MLGLADEVINLTKFKKTRSFYIKLIKAWLKKRSFYITIDAKNSILFDPLLDTV
jgi:hypothetical protein